MEENIQNTKEYKMAEELETALNTYGWNPKTFAKSTLHYHRTIQQTLFKTVVAVLREYAEMDTDPRNEASKEGSKQLLEVIDNLYIPFI